MLEAVVVVAGILGGLAVLWHYGVMKVWNAFWRTWNPRPCSCGGKSKTCTLCGGKGWLPPSSNQ